jgi:ribosomal protein L40E
VTEQDPGPAAAQRPAPLTRREKRVVALAAAAPVAVALAVLAVVGVVVGAGPGEVVGAAMVYGGLLALATGFVAFDRVQARQCPRCQQRNPRTARTCATCGYDVGERPRYACEERHRAYLEPGRCDCGRRLQQLPAVRGLGRQVGGMLRVGGWLLAFLLGLGVLLRLLD